MAFEWLSETHRPAQSSVAIIAFPGWNDASDVSGTVIRSLMSSVDARQIATTTDTSYFNLQDYRPDVVFKNGVCVSVVWPAVEVASAQIPVLHGGIMDCVFIVAPEPNHDWLGYSSELIDFLEVLDVREVIILGAYGSNVPHTRPYSVHGTSSDLQRIIAADLDPGPFTDQFSPGGINSVFGVELSAAAIPWLGSWVGVSAYGSDMPNYKGVHEQMKWLCAYLKLDVDMSESEVLLEQWMEHVRISMEDDLEALDMVRSLEEIYDSEPAIWESAEVSPAEVSELEISELAEDVEKFLRDQGPSS